MKVNDLLIHLKDYYNRTTNNYERKMIVLFVSFLVDKENEDVTYLKSLIISKDIVKMMLHMRAAYNMLDTKPSEDDIEGYTDAYAVLVDLLTDIYEGEELE